MKNTLILLFISISTLLSAQKYTFYKTGRPQAFEYNNAEKIVAKDWNIEYRYVAFNGSDMSLLDSINTINEASNKRLEAKKGVQWQDEFLREVADILVKTNQMRTLIEKEIVTINNGSEKFIHFERSCFKNHYKAYVIGQILDKGERKFFTLQVYYVNLKKQTFKLKEEKQKPLHFSYPQNGIE